MTEPIPMTDRATRLVKYSFVAGAATSVGGVANAAVVYSGVQNIDIAQFASQQLDLDGDAFNDVVLKNYVFGGNYQGANANYFPGKFVGTEAGFPDYATALSEGFLVDSTATAGGPFQVSLGYANNANSEFDSVTGAFLGLEFPINGASHFGWVRVDIDNVAGTFRIVDWAYEDEPGVGILTPEPGSLALLAAGAAGVAGLRRRKKESAA